jgi:N,N'-diacetyllegionaminate synthase
MRKEIQIRNRTVGEGHPLFIVAECGVTCNYDMKIAKELIQVVRESGADGIKFIFWFPEEIMSDKNVLYEYDTINGRKSENMYEMLSQLSFSLDQWQEIKAYADEKDVILFSTVNSPSGIDYAEALGLEAYKMSSWDFNYIPLWRRIAELGKPMIIDTGPVNSLELAEVMHVMKNAGNEQSILVHCVHTKEPAQINMRSIPYMNKAFNSLVGYSSNFSTPETDIMAVTLGAVFLENRLTMSRSLPGHHHVISREPKEFAEWVQQMRGVQAALGEYDLKPSQGDLRERKRWFRHIVANQDIPKGTVLSEDILEGKRPENGISPEYLEFLVGRRTKRDLAYNEAISWKDI